MLLVNNLKNKQNTSRNYQFAGSGCMQPFKIARLTPTRIADWTGPKIFYCENFGERSKNYIFLTYLIRIEFDTAEIRLKRDLSCELHSSRKFLNLETPFRSSDPLVHCQKRI